MCQDDNACTGFPLAGALPLTSPRLPNMTCYKGGQTVFNNHHMCDVYKYGHSKFQLPISILTPHLDCEIIGMLPN